MNDSLKADARRFRLSLAASVFLNMGLLVLVAWLGRPTDLSQPQGRPHLRMVTLSRRPAPASSARSGTRVEVSLTEAAVSLPPRQPSPRHAARRKTPSSTPMPHPSATQVPVREAASPPPALRVVTTTRPSARAFPHPVVPDPPVQAPPRPLISRPLIPLPPRLPNSAVGAVAAPAFTVTVPPPVPDIPMSATPSAPPALAAPTVRVTARHEAEASRGTTGRGAGWGEGTQEDTNRRAGGPFGIGDGLAAEGLTRHIVYVLDTSGSMKSRLDRAEDELTESLRGLRPGETFNIITFSGRSELFDPDMAEAAPGNIQRATAFLSGLAAYGDTDLEDAVVRALMLRDVNEIVVLTDGAPTIGETDPEKLAQSLRRFNLRHARISTIGLVGRNPDGTGSDFAAARLLQRIARDSGGASKLVNLGSATP